MKAAGGNLGKKGADAFKKPIITASRYILGAVFVYASIEKIAFPGEFVAIVKDYRMIPDQYAPVVAAVLPWLELTLGILLIAGLFIKESAGLISVLLLAFMISLIMKSRDGVVDNCGCFGIASGSQKLISLLVRDMALMIMAVVSVLKHPFSLIIQNNGQRKN